VVSAPVVAEPPQLQAPSPNARTLKYPTERMGLLFDRTLFRPRWSANPPAAAPSASGMTAYGAGEELAIPQEGGKDEKLSLARDNLSLGLIVSLPLPPQTPQLEPALVAEPRQTGR
jgi:hypothetical protein